MPQLGYALSSEEHSPNDLVHHAQRAEEVGFSFALTLKQPAAKGRVIGKSPFAGQRMKQRQG